MNPKLLIISLFGLACTINGQDTDSTKPIANVPKPLNQLTMDDLPSPLEIEAGMIAPNRAIQDIQAAIQNQMMAELLGNETENEVKAAWTNFPPLPGARSAQLLPTGSPRPTDMGASTSRSSGTQADGMISVGNIQVVYNDELRTIMRDYNITPEEIKQMLELYAKGGEATIMRQRTNYETGIQEIVKLDLENFTSRRPDAPITSVSPTADPLPGPGSTSPPVDPLQDFQLSTEAYLQEQIKELDAQFEDINAAYRHGRITRLTRNENAVINRDERRRFETDLQAIQMEISRRTGGETTEPRVPLGVPGGWIPPRGQTPLPNGQLPGQFPRYMTPEQRAALRRELVNIRQREQLIFQRLIQLRNRNLQLLPMVRDPFRQQLRRRISFANGNRPLLTRTLRRSVTGQGVLRRRVV